MYHLAGADEYQFPGASPPYVLDLIPLAAGLAAISTDGQLALFDPSRIGAGPKHTCMTAHGNLTTVRAFDASGSVLATAGANGTVALWDLRESAAAAVTAASAPHASIHVGTSRNPTGRARACPSRRRPDAS